MKTGRHTHTHTHTHQLALRPVLQQVRQRNVLVLEIHFFHNDRVEKVHMEVAMDEILCARFGVHVCSFIWVLECESEGEMQFCFYSLWLNMLYQTT